MTQFTRLDTFLKAWFHQDFDLDGDVPEVIARYRANASPDEVAALRQDIHRFLAEAGDRADRAFVREFEPDIDLAGWNMTVHEWLNWIDRLLASGSATG